MITLSRYQAGEVIIRENDAGDTAYIIEQGQVEVTKELDGQKVHLAYLESGETFGEMSMIDDKPRSATVTAVTETVVSEIRREDLFQSLQTDPGVALNLLKTLFERLREAHTTILQLQKLSVPHGLVPIAPPPKLSMRTTPTVVMEGLTPQAARALPTTPFQIIKFPFRVGRQSEDPLVYNDLMLPDVEPLQISRHHLAFVMHEGRVGIVDRGSRLGSWVDDQLLGGPEGFPGPLFFAGREGTLVLGTRRSPFRYKIVIEE